MKTGWMALAFGLVLGSSAGQAQALKDCAAMKSDAVRLACFDAAAAAAAATPATALPAVPTPAPSQAGDPPSVTTQEMVKPIAPSDYKVADPDDLKVAPRKFLHKPVELRHAHCYYADVGDYRCTAPGFASVAVFSTDIEPAVEKTRLESECGAIKVAMTARCERTLHLVVDDFTEDQIDGNLSRVTLVPKAIVIVADKKR